MKSIHMKILLVTITSSLLLAASPAQALSTATPKNHFTYSQMLTILQQGALGGQEKDKRQVIQHLETVWDEFPDYLDHWMTKMKILYSPEETEKNRFRPPLARHLVRFYIEAAAAAAATDATTSGMVPQKTTAPYESDIGQNEDYQLLLRGDLLFANQDYETAIDVYQRGINLGQERSNRDCNHCGMIQHLETMRRKDDIFFTKIAFAYCKLNKPEDAARHFSYAADIQEQQGLFLEAVVSRIRQNQLGLADVQSSALAPYSSLLAEYYPTVARILAKGEVPQVLSGQDSNTNDKTLLEKALASLIRGEYSASHQFFAQIPDTHPEKWGLFSILLRERQLDDVADCYSQLVQHSRPDDPIALMKRGALHRAVKRDCPYLPQLVVRDDRVTRKHDGQVLELDALDCLKGVTNLDYTAGVGSEVAADSLMLEAIEHLESSALRASAYLQVARYFLPSSIPPESQEEEQRRDEQLKKQLAYLEKALEEPEIMPSVRIAATVGRVNAELSLAENQLYNGESGSSLLPQDNNSGVKNRAVTAWGSTTENEGFTPRKQTKSESAREERAATLAKCADRLTELGLEKSVAALTLARQLEDTQWERDLLAEIFGESSAPVLNMQKKT